MPRPNLRGMMIDFHTHLLAHRHCRAWFEAARHYGIDAFLSMTPLEEAVRIQRDWPGRVLFIVVPKWHDDSQGWVDDWLRRIEAFYNIGSRMVKFHMAPSSIQRRGKRLDDPVFRPIFREAIARDMAIMTHVGDPETWYATHYAENGKFGTHEEHLQMWENVLTEYPGVPWIGAHMGGYPEDLPRLQSLLDRYPDLWLDCSATKWMVREFSKRRDEAREFIIANSDRIIWGSDQVSSDDRGFDFLASRFWAYRKLLETARIGPSPIHDPDLPDDQQPVMRGLALPDEVLQKLYHDNAMRFMALLGTGFGWG
jgi:predicted TIM-barrel fold metal-dependent hydrolase